MRVSGEASAVGFETMAVTQVGQFGCTAMIVQHPSAVSYELRSMVRATKPFSLNPDEVSESLPIEGRSIFGGVSRSYRSRWKWTPRQVLVACFSALKNAWRRLDVGQILTPFIRPAGNSVNRRRRQSDEAGLRRRAPTYVSPRIVQG